MGKKPIWQYYVGPPKDGRTIGAIVIALAIGIPILLLVDGIAHLVHWLAHL